MEWWGGEGRGRFSGLSQQLSQLIFADITALVADEKKLGRLVLELGRVCERRKQVNEGI